jgi:hypothetical protein
MRPIATVRMYVGGALAAWCVLTAVNASQAEDKWGTIKGQVIFGSDKVPTRPVLNVDKNRKECLDDQNKKELLAEEWVVDPKTKGLKWALVYLIPANAKVKEDVAKPIPIHPKLTKVKLENVVIDQPCCKFDPYVVALRDGQSITVKNSMTIGHNCKVDGNPAVGNPAVNLQIPPGEKVEIGPFHPQWNNIPVSCSSHGWMKGHIRVFSHPYFYVTGEDGEFEIKDAPAGTYRLVIWHPGNDGLYVVGEKEPDKFGIPIEIKADKTTELKPFTALPPKEEKK